MSDHPNLAILRRGYAAFAAGDIPTLAEVIAPDATWHVGGRNRMSGDYSGHERIFGFFGALAEGSEGTFGLEVRDMFANDDRGVVLVRVSAAGSHGRTLDQPAVHVLDIVDGQVVDFRDHPSDQHQFDAYWG